MGLDLERLREANVLRSSTAFKHPLDRWSVAEWGNATAGECGEACNVAKKMLRFDTNVLITTKKTREDYKKELATEIADTLIYLDLWAASEGINLSEAVIVSFNNKSDEKLTDIRL